MMARNAAGVCTAGHGSMEAYRRDLFARLPADLAEEVADGLADACEHYKRGGLSPDQAAAAAISEFGDTSLVVDAFRRASPVRRVARILIMTGPAVGGWWAAALIGTRAWDWPIAANARLAVGPLVAACVALLAIAVLTRRYQVLRRAGVAGCLGVALLDASVVTTVLVLGPIGRWLLIVAACVSAARLAFIAGAMRRVLPQPGT